MFRFTSCIVFSLLIGTTFNVSAQLMIEQGPSASTRDGGIYIYGLTGKENRLRYEKINGSPFLLQDWRQATLYDRNGKSFGKFRVKLNLATHEIHYLDKSGIEKADNGQIARVELDSMQESSTAGRVYSNQEEVIKNKFKGEVKFAVHMNDGNYSLLRVTVREVAKSDSLFSTMNKFYFKDNNFYFLKSGRQTFFLRRLSVQELRKYIPADKWPLQRNDFDRNSISREEDVIVLLNVINRQG